MFVIFFKIMLNNVTLRVEKTGSFRLKNGLKYLLLVLYFKNFNCHICINVVDEFFLV